VRAPADGYVTNLALRKGARVTAQSPVMAFIDTSETIFGVEIPQVYARYVAVGQPVEITFKTFPGEVYTGRVEAVLQAIATGQTQTGGLAVAPTDIQSAPFVNKAFPLAVRPFGVLFFKARDRDHTAMNRFPPQPADESSLEQLGAHRASHNQRISRSVSLNPETRGSSTARRCRLE
jgi:Barrel-sandwich domain of CusB or HlyD membrane-fusion